jgi:hypothetical protein
MKLEIEELLKFAEINGHTFNEAELREKGRATCENGCQRTLVVDSQWNSAIAFGCTRKSVITAQNESQAQKRA